MGDVFPLHAIREGLQPLLQPYLCFDVIQRGYLSSSNVCVYVSFQGLPPNPFLPRFISVSPFPPPPSYKEIMPVYFFTVIFICREPINAVLKKKKKKMKMPC